MSKIGQKVLEIEETTGKSVEEIAEEELEDKVNKKGSCDGERENSRRN